MDKEKKDLLVFGYGLGIIALIFCAGGTLRHGWGLAQMVQAGCAFIFIAVTLLNWQALYPGYRGWMKVAHLIGGVVTTVILSTVFFLIFAPIGLLFRLIGKDHLDRKIDKLTPSYWHLRAKEDFVKERYTQQF